GVGISSGLGRSVVQFDVERRHLDVRLDGGVRAFEFDRLFSSIDRIDCALKDVDLGIAVNVAGGLIDFEELRLTLKVVEKEDAGVFRNAQATCNLKQGSLSAFEFFVELDGCWRRGLGDAI